MVEWFRHDTDAHNNIKLRKLTRDFGLAGIGAFWLLVEVLYRNNGTTTRDKLLDELDFYGQTEMLDVLVSYGLFTVNGEKVTCTRVQEEMAYQEEQHLKKSEAGRRGNEVRWAEHRNAIATQSQCDSNESHSDRTASQSIAQDNTRQDNNNPLSVSNDTSSPQGEKGEKKVVRFVKPSLDEVRAYCSERGNSVDPETFIDFYESKGWKVGNQSMKDWKAAVRTWERSRGGYTPVASQRRKMTTDPEKRGRYVNEDGSLNLLGN